MITGSTRWFAAGGGTANNPGGGTSLGLGGAGGTGGGGSGTPNTGSGGGGTRSGGAGNGGSGIVIISYAGPELSSISGLSYTTYVTSGGRRVYEFLSGSGTITL